MTKGKRTALFLTLCVLFLIIAPSLIFYSLGYAFDFEKLKIVQTGALFVSTEPGGANIYISGKLRGSTGTIFKSLLKKKLLPKTYLVELKKDGYYSWKKNLEIKERFTTEAKDILLLPENPPKQKISENGITSFLVSPDEKKIAYLDSKNQFRILNIESKNDIPVPETEKLEKIEKISWSGNSKNIYFKAQSEKKTENFIWQEETKNIINIGSIFINSSIYNPVEFNWNPNDSNQIYFSDLQKNENYLGKISLNEKSISPNIIKNFKNYLVFENGIYFIDKSSGIVFQTDPEGKSVKQLSISALPDFNEKNGDYKILAFPQIISIIGNNGNFYVLNQKSQSFEKIGENITNAIISKDSKKLLYYGPNEVWIMFLDNVLIQPFRYKGDKEMIGRFASPIEDACWLPDSEHLLMASKNAIKITELDGRDGRNTIDFLNGAFPYFSKTDKKIYFIEGEKLYSVKL